MAKLDKEISINKAKKFFEILFYPLTIKIKDYGPKYRIYYILFTWTNLGIGTMNHVVSCLNIGKKFKKISIDKDLIIENKAGVFHIRKSTMDFQIISDYYEAELKPFFDQMEEGIFIDVGANIGKWSIYMANRLEDRGRILSFEPFAENHLVLLKNILINECTNIIPLQVALSDVECTGSMTVEDPSNLGWISLYKANEEANDHCAHEVQVRLLDNIIAEQNIDISKVKLLKIDVEGHELEVLRGCQNLLRKSEGLMIIFESFESNLQNVKHFLNEHNFYVSRINEDNYLALKNE